MNYLVNGDCDDGLFCNENSDTCVVCCGNWRDTANSWSEVARGLISGKDEGLLYLL